MKKLLVAAAFISLPISSSVADMVVIANPSLSVDSLSSKEASRLFLGKKTTFDSGESVSLYDLPDSHDRKWTFYKSLTRKGPSQLNSYWTRKLFTGDGEPPQETSSVNQMKSLVASNKSALGYIPADQVDSSVKVLLTVPE